MEEIFVRIDGLIGQVPAVTRGERWNGWECPLFRRADAEHLIRKLRAADGAFESSRYEEGAFITAHTDDDYDEVWEVEMIDGVEYWPIGSHAWCWSRVPEDEVRHA